MKKEFPIKPSPIKEGKTKSNVKKSDGKGRQAPPPPPAKKEVPLFDSYTGEPNPLYEELTGKPNPLLGKWSKEDFHNVPQYFEPILKHRFLVVFPENLDIKPYYVTDIKLPTQSLITNTLFGLRHRVETTDLEIKMVDSATSPKLPLFHSIFKDNAKFNMAIEIIDSKNIVVQRFELQHCSINRIECQNMSYENQHNQMFEYRLSISPQDFVIK